MMELHAPANFVAMKKSRFLVDDNNYYYRINRTKGSVSFWKCRQYYADKCYARAITEKDCEVEFLKQIKGD